MDASRRLTRGAAVAVDCVVKRYGERITALRDVSLDVRAGEIVLVSGPSGSGKSTLLNLIAGFDRPDSGRIVVDGRAVGGSREAARYRREMIGFVFQLHHLIPGLTAEENVEMPLMPAHRRRPERLALARAALSEVGLDERRTHLPAQLSGGERQRVALARAIVGRPRLLLADEPTGSLDSEAGAQVMELLAGLSRRHGTTVLVVSHDPRAARYADRVLRIRDGRLTGENALSPTPR